MIAISQKLKGYSKVNGSNVCFCVIDLSHKRFNVISLFRVKKDLVQCVQLSIVLRTICEDLRIC